MENGSQYIHIGLALLGQGLGVLGLWRFEKDSVYQVLSKNEGPNEQELLLRTKVHQRIARVEFEDVLLEICEEVIWHKATFNHETVHERHQRVWEQLLT